MGVVRLVCAHLVVNEDAARISQMTKSMKFAATTVVIVQKAENKVVGCNEPGGGAAGAPLLFTDVACDRVRLLDCAR